MLNYQFYRWQVRAFNPGMRACTHTAYGGKCYLYVLNNYSRTINRKLRQILEIFRIEHYYYPHLDILIVPKAIYAELIATLPKSFFCLLSILFIIQHNTKKVGLSIINRK